MGLYKGTKSELDELEGPADADVFAVEAFAMSQEGDYALNCDTAWDMLETHDEFINSL
jgi:hypothetical protein